ncbi:MAG: cysteine desulfurase [Gemmatimonadota bacterium]
MTAPAIVPAAPPRSGRFDVEQVRRDFPALDQLVNGHPLVYLDSGATAQKPLAVIEALTGFLTGDNANVHRGVHTLSQRATELYDRARERTRRFLGAAEADEIIFTAGTTAAINLVAQSWGRRFLSPGDEILLTELEHHSNIVPWQLIRDFTGAVIKVIPITDAGDLDLASLDRLLSRRTRLVALTHVSNVLGTVNSIRQIADRAHAVGAWVLVDGAQSVPHLPIDVQALGADFFIFSGHKLYGPTGIGVLYGRRELLDRMPPWQGGGGMIGRVSFQETTFAPVPNRFEAGTPPIAEAIGLAAAMDYLESIPSADRIGHEASLLRYAERRLAEVPGVRVLGRPVERVGVVSFNVDDTHPHDVGTILDHEGIAVRTGHHCAQPLMHRLGVPSTVRASFGVYNRVADVDALVEGLGKVRQVMG